MRFFKHFLAFTSVFALGVAASNTAAAKLSGPSTSGEDYEALLREQPGSPLIGEALRQLSKQAASGVQVADLSGSVPSLANPKVKEMVAKVEATLGRSLAEATPSELEQAIANVVENLSFDEVGLAADMAGAIAETVAANPDLAAAAVSGVQSGLAKNTATVADPVASASIVEKAVASVASTTTGASTSADSAGGDQY